MPRYAAFLRGVSPLNARMSEVRKAFEGAGFSEVRTVRSSGNVVFSARAAPEAVLERRAEAAMRKQLGTAFPAIVRSIERMKALIESDPYQDFRIDPVEKRVVTFLRDRLERALSLPIEIDGVRILCILNREVLSTYRPNPRGPVFMMLIEKTLGRDITTRTWDTLRKVAGPEASRREGPPPPRSRQRSDDRDGRSSGI
jgi:uncharacterized protein (DUF1697 family)